MAYARTLSAIVVATLIAESNARMSEAGVSPRQATPTLWRQRDLVPTESATRTASSQDRTPSSNLDAKAKLQNQISFEFSERPLADCIARISELAGVRITLDKNALQTRGISEDVAVTLKLKDISAKSALRILVNMLNLEYRIVGMDVIIAPRPKPETRVYQVGDLVHSDYSAVRFRADGGGAVDVHRTPSDERTADYDSLIELIEQVIAPNTWASVGGEGTIEADNKNSSLIILQTNAAHDQIEDLLAQLFLLNGSGSAQYLRKNGLGDSELATHLKSAAGSRSGLPIRPGRLFLGAAILVLGGWLAWPKSTIPREFCQPPVDRIPKSLFQKLQVPWLFILRAGIIAMMVLSGWLIGWPIWKRHQLIGALTVAVRAEDHIAVRRAVVAIMNRDLGADAVPSVIEILRCKNSSNVVLACRVLGVFGADSQAAVPTLIELMADEDVSLRDAAAACLGEIGPPARDAIPELIERLEHDRLAELFANSIKPIIGFGGRSGTCCPNRYSNEAWAQLTQQTLLRIGPDAVPLLIRTLADARSEVRGGAAIVLASFGRDAKEAVPQLAELANDPDKTARLAAARALWILDRQVEPAIQEYFKLRAVRDDIVSSQDYGEDFCYSTFLARFGIDRDAAAAVRGTEHASDIRLRAVGGSER